MLKKLFCAACATALIGAAGVAQAQEPKVAVRVNTEAAAAPSNTFRVTSVLGTEVQNNEGQKLGDVKDLVVDAESHQIAYIVLGQADNSEELMAVPSGAFVVKQYERAAAPATVQPGAPAAHPHRHYFVLNVPVETWQKAPRFAVREWNDAYITPQWRTQIDSYYQPFIRPRGPIERRVNRAERALDRAEDRAEETLEKVKP